MKLHLLRHGKSVRDGEDRTRPLAPRGEFQGRWLGERLRDQGFVVDRVLHSPKLRARRTAELVCARALPEAPVELVDWLLPDDDVGPWVERLDEETEDLLLVGHNPFMEQLAQRLVGEALRFKTATLASFRRRDDGGWELAGLITPPKEDV